MPKVLLSHALLQILSLLATHVERSLASSSRLSHPVAATLCMGQADGTVVLDMASITVLTMVLVSTTGQVLIILIHQCRHQWLLVAHHVCTIHSRPLKMVLTQLATS